ncbi:MAG: tRNA 2-thiouridine(34) synthase MnmA [Parcubacteria group bacterium]|jgi:tRNA-specific 2-thiouridylase
MKRAKTSDGKILVALSGGVDSAVAAMLLKNQGCEVVGVFLRLFSGKKNRDAFGKAKKIAKALNIKLISIGAGQAFKKKVIDYFLESYKKGITPNPCVVCNKEIKFRLLIKLAKKYKANYIATGHYARIKEFQIPNFKFQIKSKFQNPKLRITNCKLLEAADKKKDQSYFLYKLTQRELAKTIFPLENYTKDEVKKIAKKLKLPVEKSESQDVCFIDKDISSFLKKHLRLKPGNIINEEGNILGKHQGLALFTIGQRKGLEIGGTGPYFVTEKKLGRNELVVSNNPADPSLSKKIFGIEKPNWIAGDLKFPSKAKVRIRYQAPLFDAIIKKDKRGSIKVSLKKPLRSLTPGQSAVFYRGEEALGGGIIS